MRRSRESLWLVLTCASTFFFAQYLGYLRHEERARSLLSQAQALPKVAAYRLAWRNLPAAEVDAFTRTAERAALLADAPSLSTEVLRHLRLSVLAADEEEAQLQFLHAAGLCPNCQLGELEEIACIFAAQRVRFSNHLRACALNAGLQ